MGQYSRAELEEMWQRFIVANEKSEAEDDWQTPLANFYAEDAVWHWKVGYHTQFRAEGRQQIVDYVLGHEMLGFEGWTYPYDKVVVDDQKGEIVGYWNQITPFKKKDGSFYRTNGLGVSWFKYGGNYQWIEQLDIFDTADIGGLIESLGKADLVTEKLKKRMESYLEGSAPGTYPA